MNTPFKAWRLGLGLSQTGAARALGIHRSQVVRLDLGHRPDRGTPVTPSKQLRLAMAAVKAGLRPIKG